MRTLYKSCLSLVMRDCVFQTVDTRVEYGDVRPLDEARMRTLTINGCLLYTSDAADE